MDASNRTRVSEKAAHALARKGRRRRFADGEFIQQQGDSSEGFWLIESGRVVVCRHGSDGELTIFAILGSGELFGELAYFAGVRRQVDALAKGDVGLVWIDSAVARTLLQSEPDFAFTLLRSLAEQLRDALDRIDEQRNLSAETRLARMLVELAIRDGPAVRCTQQELSDRIGVSRVTTGHILSRFARAGLIELGYRRIEVPDADALGNRFGIR